MIIWAESEMNLNREEKLGENGLNRAVFLFRNILCVEPVVPR